MAENIKRDYLKDPVKHIDIKSFDSTQIINSMKDMSFTARDTARAAEIYDTMLKDKNCTIFLSIAGSTSSAGCMQIYVDLVKNNMVDAIIATGATIVDMDFFEALGFKHYKGSPDVDDNVLRKNYIDRIYDTFIDEEELLVCDQIVKKIADQLPERPYSSREFIAEMGRYLVKNSKKKDSLIETAFKNDVPIFCPAFSDSSAGFGLVCHQWEKPEKHLSIDSVKDFLELTKVKIASKDSGILMIGGGVPKNFIQDTVVCAEVLGFNVAMHKYAVQITVADVRDGACSSSTLKEASSWGKVKQGLDQMVYAEATSVLPLIASYAYHQGNWKEREPKKFSIILNGPTDFKNFLNIEPKYSNFKDSKAVIIPFPYEASSSYGKGSKFGPQAIISASSQIELFDIESGKEIYKEVGISTLPQLEITENSEEFYLPLAEKTKEIVSENKFPIILGGEHTITFGGVMGIKEKYKSFSVLHFDAHSDLRDNYEGNKFSHACVMRRVQEIPEVKSIVQLGIRNISNEKEEGSEFDFLNNNKERIKVFWAKDKDKWEIEDILKDLEDNVYLTFDVDVFDSSIMPSTGTPEPGGLDWYLTSKILKEVFKRKNVVALDVVELSPIKDIPAPDFMIAKLIYNMIGYKFLNY